MIHYAYITIILAAIECWRIKRTWGKVGNINHWLSYLLAFAGMVGPWFIAGQHASFLYILLFVFGCGAIRGLLYDISLNVLVNFFITPRAIAYISANSNSLNEDRLTKIGFWWRRGGFALLLAIVLFIQYKYL